MNLVLDNSGIGDVTRIWCKDRGTKLREHNLRVTHKILWNLCSKQCQSYRPVYYFWVDINIESNVSSHGSEVTWKNKQLEIEGGGHMPQCPIVGDANAKRCFQSIWSWLTADLLYISNRGTFLKYTCWVFSAYITRFITKLCGFNILLCNKLTTR